MNKWTTGVSCLAAVGCLLSGLLVYSHYYPDFRGSLCGEAGWMSCRAVNESAYSIFLGFPLAAYGLLFYLVVLTTTLVAANVKGPYPELAFALLLPAVVAAILVDLVLVSILINIRLFCLLCSLTYFVNLALLLTFVFWFRTQQGREDLSVSRLKILLHHQWRSPEQKVASTCYLLFIAFLAVSVFSSIYILRIETSSSRFSQEQIDGMLRQFYSRKVESISFPPTNLIIGLPQARVKIVAFTDFLCPPCRRIFEMDDRLHHEFGDDLSISYFNYPLDRSCNPYVTDTIHQGSCVASEAILTAADLEVLSAYRIKLFEETDDSPDDFSRDTALKLSAGVADSATFARKMAESTTSDIIKRDVELAEKLKVRATPTLFIDGRRVDGIPPLEVLETIIRKEIADQKASPGQQQ